MWVWSDSTRVTWAVIGQGFTVCVCVCVCSWSCVAQQLRVCCCLRLDSRVIWLPAVKPCFLKLTPAHAVWKWDAHRVWSPVERPHKLTVFFICPLPHGLSDKTHTHSYTCSPVFSDLMWTPVLSLAFTCWMLTQHLPSIHPDGLRCAVKLIQIKPVSLQNHQLHPHQFWWEETWRFHSTDESEQPVIRSTVLLAQRKRSQTVQRHS